MTDSTTCDTCGRSAYRPQDGGSYGRMQARRCGSCNLVVGRCRCAPMAGFGRPSQPVRRFIEADGIGLAVHFDGEPTPEAIAAFQDLARWIAAHRETLRPAYGKPIKLTEAEAAESGDRQLERIERLRRQAGLE